MSKMFVHYNGTVAAFKEAGLETTYNKHIVFIKGGTDGDGAAIYTHGEYYGNVKEALAALNKAVDELKYFTSIKAGDKVASAQGKDGVITFNAADPALVSVDVDAHGVNIGLSKTFTDSVAANTANIAAEVTRATGVEDGIRADLGQKGDAASATGSAFARIAKVVADIQAMNGDNGSVADQITAAVNALKGTLDADDAATLAAINDELNAIDAKWAEYVLKSDLATEVSDNDGAKVVVTVKTKDGKVSDVLVDETQLDVALNAKANAADVYTKTEAETMAQGKVDTLANGAVKANTDAIAKLNGNDSAEGSVAKQIKDAINAFAGSANGDNVIDNVTELLNYVSGVDGSKTLAEAIAQIADNKGKIETLNGTDATAGSVAKAVKDAIDAEVGRANAAYASKSTEGVASDAAARAEDAYVLAGQKATADEAKEQAVEAISEIAEVTKSDSDNSYVKATVKTKAGSVSSVEVDDSGVKTYADSVGDAAKAHAETKISEAVGTYTDGETPASGLRKEIEERDAAVKAYADELFAWLEL